MHTETHPGSFDVIVVGGGLAGATVLARAGRSVVLLEKSSRLGGRGGSYAEADFQFNLGPHALYRNGAAARTLAELGIPYTGGVPVGGRRLICGGRSHRFPAGLRSLLMTRALSLRGRLAAARLIRQIPKLDASGLHHTSVQEWLDRWTAAADAQSLLKTFIRLSTYANAPEHQSAGAAIEQFQMALGGVLYLDGGWETLVDRLKEAAIQAGAEIHMPQRVERVLTNGRGVAGVLLKDAPRGIARMPRAGASVTRGGWEPREGIHEHCPQRLTWLRRADNLRAGCPRYPERSSATASAASAALPSRRARP